MTSDIKDGSYEKNQKKRSKEKIRIQDFRHSHAVFLMNQGINTVTPQSADWQAQLNGNPFADQAGVILDWHFSNFNQTCRHWLFKKTVTVQFNCYSFFTVLNPKPRELLT